MKKISKSNNSISRRKFLGNTAAVAAFSVVPLSYGFKNPSYAVPEQSEKPNSNFGGIQIGAITYSWRSIQAALRISSNIARSAVSALLS